MSFQPRVRSAISRTTLVLLLVCLSATGVLAATKNSDVAISDDQNPAPQTSAAAPMPTPPVGMSRATDKQSEQGRQYGQPGFVGEPINLNVVNADIRDILNYITEQYGVNFVIDSSVSCGSGDGKRSGCSLERCSRCGAQSQPAGHRSQRQHPACGDDRRAGQRKRKLRR